MTVSEQHIVCQSAHGKYGLWFQELMGRVLLQKGF